MKGMLAAVMALNLTTILCFQSSIASFIGLDITPSWIRSVMGFRRELLRERAVRVWEQAIAAKGGRNRLHAVRNMVISSHGEYKAYLLRENRFRREEIYVFPDKYWAWDDYRPDVFGLRVSMYNLETNMKYVISDGEPNCPLEPITNKEREVQRKILERIQLIHLLETQWVKPNLVKASVGNVGGRLVDIVQAEIGGRRVDFAIDRETHLPIRVSFYSLDRGETYVDNVDLSDYVEVEGIKMPRVVKPEGGTGERSSYQFNVEYNEEIFKKPPSLEAGPEVWRVSR